jgi:serine phosphatase RsbU (regulator of sigma subunit)
VGDVSGHGAGPALLMALTRSYLRACAQNRSGPGGVLEQVNGLMSQDVEGDRYITLLLARLDMDTRVLTYASAGHATGYVLNARNEIKAELPSTGIPLGINPDESFVTSPPVELAEDDLVLLLTDGIVDARDPHSLPFGLGRVLDLVRVYREAPAREIAVNLYHAVRAFSRNLPQDDDITATVIKVGSGPAENGSPTPHTR